MGCVGMKPVLLALVMKPVIGFALALAYFFVLLLSLRWVERKLPDSRIKRFLFRERGRYSTRRPTDTSKRAFNDVPLVGRE